jgi:AraC family transcriptional regulator
MVPTGFPAPAQLFAHESVASARALPTERLASSLDAGWTSLLLEHHMGRDFSPPFTTLATPDQTIVIATRGDHDIESQVHGRWRKAVYRPGSGGMTPGGDTATLRWSSRAANTFSTAHLYMPQMYFRDAQEHYRRIGQRSHAERLNALVFHDEILAQTVRGLLEAMMNGAPDLYAQAAAQWLAVHILSRHSGWIDLDSDRRAVTELSDRRLARVVDYMRAHFAKPLMLDELADEAAISKFHFVRLFRKKTGRTPYAYLFQLRMDAARRLLATTDLQIADVARACGFASASHFGTAFARTVGMTPTRFRKNAGGALTG